MSKNVSSVLNKNSSNKVLIFTSLFLIINPHKEIDDFGQYKKKCKPALAAINNILFLKYWVFWAIFL